MSTTLMAAIYERGPTNATQRAVLLALAFYISDKSLMTDPTCFPSFSTLADRTALSEPTVKRAVKELTSGDAPWLKAEPRTRSNGALTSNLYTLNIARILDDDSYPSITTIQAPSITVTPPLYHSDTTLVSPRSHPSITVIPLDPVIESERESVSEQGERKPPPVVISRPVDRTPGGRKTKLPPDEPIPETEPAMIRAAPEAVRLLWRLTSYWPPPTIHAALAERLGDRPDEDLLRTAITLWNMNGYRPGNWDGICDYYDNLLQNPAWTPPRPESRKPGGGRSSAPVPNIPATGGAY